MNDCFIIHNYHTGKCKNKNILCGKFFGIESNKTKHLYAITIKYGDI